MQNMHLNHSHAQYAKYATDMENQMSYAPPPSYAHTPFPNARNVKNAKTNAKYANIACSIFSSKCVKY